MRGVSSGICIPLSHWALVPDQLRLHTCFWRFSGSQNQVFEGTAFSLTSPQPRLRAVLRPQPREGWSVAQQTSTLWSQVAFLSPLTSDQNTVHRMCWGYILAATPAVGKWTPEAWYWSFLVYSYGECKCRLPSDMWSSLRSRDLF
jgi:hypothetical protein